MSEKEPANRARGTSEIEAEATHRDWDQIGADFNFDVIPKSPSVTRIVNRINTDKEKLHDYVRKKRAEVKLRIDNPPAMKLRDKLSFTLGLADVILTAFLLGYAPYMVVFKYSIQIPLLMSLRFYYYRKAKHHYFLLDFCYFANLLLVAYLYIFPQSCTLFQVCFAFTTGPLCWAIGVWRNSLVFHSLDKVTSLFIHAIPPLVTWAIRWFPTPLNINTCQADNGYISFYDATIFPLIPYVLWQAVYYIIVQVIRKEKFKADPERLTSFIWMQRDKHSPVHRLMKTFGHRWEVVMFGVLQLIFTIVAMAPIKLFYENFYAHTLFLILVMSISAWNGSSFYFEVFSKKYQTQLTEYEREWNDLSQVLKNTPTKKE